VPVRTLGRERIEDVHDAQHLREQRNLVALESIGIAGTVEAFVVMADDRSYAPEGSQRPAEPVADVGMALDHLAFAGRERPGLQQHAVGNANLAGYRGEIPHD